ncbi:hypothetical protein [Hydromonas duriensis]|uniref:Uncharacterized protein n=1 Tax=Hydromonas duriensis TaxID=1527608 RepID=A0A4R6Y0A9_9BURK|nr:hypothetical protein [Hydromonas duriensis]TDR27025.1 hypothetical protein DFR44_1533 [Hydromonas duriensis]
MKKMLFFLVCMFFAPVSAIFAQDAQTTPVSQFYPGSYYGDWVSTIQVSNEQNKQLEQVVLTTRAINNKDAQLSFGIEVANSCAFGQVPYFSGRLEDFVSIKVVNAKDPSCPSCLTEIKPSIKQGESHVTWEVDGQDFDFIQRVNASYFSGLSLADPIGQDITSILKAFDKGKKLSITISGMPSATFSLNGYSQIKTYALKLCAMGKWQ